MPDCLRAAKRAGLCVAHAARAENKCVCKVCGTEWDRPIGRAGLRKFCSDECHRVARAQSTVKHRANKLERLGGDAYKAQQAEAIKAWRHANPEAWKAIARRRHLMGTYKITPEQYDAMLERQGGGCAICGAVEADAAGRQLHVDHDHACCPGGRSCGNCIRGLLCKPCNMMLGFAQDDAERLRAGLLYLAQRQRLTSIAS